jgi:NAD(P)H-dependent FMN reductase
MLNVDGGRMTTSTSPDTVTDPRSPASLRVAVIAASVRDGRMSRTLADWAAARVAAAGCDVDLVDLADHELPPDRLLQPGGGPRSPIADRIGRADGYVFVSPEYNHSFPGTLKQAIDWHYREWMFKAATVLSYGVQGGLLAAEHLRGVLAELNVVTTRRVVGLRAPWDDVDAAGFASPPGVSEAFDAAVRELGWWADTLRTARRERPLPR